MSSQEIEPDLDADARLCHAAGDHDRALGDCRACALRVHYKLSIPPLRAITICPEPQDEVLRVGRAGEQTSDLAADYAWRVSVEGTIAQGMRWSWLRRTPYF